MALSTKRGDQGKSYWLKKAVEKDDVLLQSVGAIDELQCFLGMAKAEIEYGFLKNEVEEIQKELWMMAGELAGYKKGKKVKEFDFKKKIKKMELEIEKWERELPMIRDFKLPGENKKEAILQLCRSMVRRVERRIVSLSKKEKVNLIFLPYLNRLSDYLFMMAMKVTK